MAIRTEEFLIARASGKKNFFALIARAAMALVRAKFINKFLRNIIPVHINTDCVWLSDAERYRW